jgi:uncharacterized protein (TIGR03083 family)
VSEQEKDTAPILVAELFPEVRRELLQVLEGLSPEEWERQTAAPLWSVKDVALHLLGGDVSNLSRRRDAFRLPGKAITEYRELVEFINSWNAQWIAAARKMSPRVLCDLLALTGPQLAEYFASLDPFVMGKPVSWAGPDPAPVWLDIAREYTEQWHHQQQIRDATGRPPLYPSRLFAPVLDTLPARYSACLPGCCRAGGHGCEDPDYGRCGWYMVSRSHTSRMEAVADVRYGASGVDCHCARGGVAVVREGLAG